MQGYTQWVSGMLGQGAKVGLSSINMGFEYLALGLPSLGKVTCDVSDFVALRLDDAVLYSDREMSIDWRNATLVDRLPVHLVGVFFAQISGEKLDAGTPFRKRAFCKTTSRPQDIIWLGVVRG